MPEIPDLENIIAFLNGKIPGVRIDSVEPRIPIVIRFPTADDLAKRLAGQTLSGVSRRGKFLLFKTESGDTLAVNPMLTGRFQYVEPETKTHAKTCFTLKLGNGMDLRYHDMRVMGKVYCVGPGEESIIPNFERMGPDALDPDLTLEVFKTRLRRFTGQVKRILVTDTFLAGIGNAYSDEILFDAGIYPFRRRTTLSDEEVENLYNSMHSVLAEATRVIGERMDGRIDLKIRDFLKIHRKGGQDCPSCGGRIGEVKANQRMTNFCRTCQK